MGIFCVRWGGRGGSLQVTILVSHVLIFVLHCKPKLSVHGLVLGVEYM